MNGATIGSVGFGAASLKRVLPPGRELPDDVDVRAVVVRRNGLTAAVVVADLCMMWPYTCRRIRAKLARRLNTPESNVGVFATQNHGAQMDGPTQTAPETSDAVFEEAVLHAVSSAREVTMLQVAVHPQRQLNLCRRIPFGDFGSFTFYYGYRVDEADRPDCSHLLRLALSSLAKGIPKQVRCLEVPATGDAAFDVPSAPIEVPTPYYAPRANDDLLQALLFRDLAGEPVGSILRIRDRTPA